MSFIITTISPETAVQVSETRHSSFLGGPPRPDLRKTFVVRGRKTHFLFGWVGLASTDDRHRHNTPDWLFKTLFEMNALELPIEDISLRLEKLATTHFADLQAHDKRSLFLMAGWQDSEPFICTVSNHLSLKTADPIQPGRHHIPSLSEAAVAAPEFRGWIQRFNNLKDQHYLVTMMGDFDPDKLKAHRMGLETLLKKRATASEISGACRHIALEASRHSKTIGRNLIGAEMDSAGEWNCRLHSEDGTDEVLMPPILSLEGCSTEGSISTVVSGDEVTVRLKAKIAKKAS